MQIPYPLETTELQNASRRALHLWTGRDAANVGLVIPGSKAGSEISSYAQTMIGSGSSRDRPSTSNDDHRMFCNGCGHVRYSSLIIYPWLTSLTFQLIVGVRYQCAHCPSKPSAFSLVWLGARNFFVTSLTLTFLVLDLRNTVLLDS